jgi:hypothetical protein
MDFKSFKKDIISTLRDKILIRIEERKQEIVEKVFNAVPVTEALHPDSGEWHVMHKGNIVSTHKGYAGANAKQKKLNLSGNGGHSAVSKASHDAKIASNARIAAMSNKNEEVELDELKASTLKSYVKKASVDRDNLLKDRSRKDNIGDHQDALILAMKQKQRESGIKAAEKKLKTEEFEISEATRSPKEIEMIANSLSDKEWLVLGMILGFKPGSRRSELERISTSVNYDETLKSLEKKMALGKGGVKQSYTADVWAQKMGKQLPSQTHQWADKLKI